MNRAFAPAAGRPVDVWLPGQQHPDAVVVNVGDVVVLLDDTPPPGSEPLELAPGESIPWDAGRGLSLAVGDLEPTPGRVLVTDNTGQSSGARAIAQAILEQGLAVDIAQAISVAGVPAIDRPVVLLPATSGTIPRGTSWLSGALNVAAYATCVVQLAASGTGTTTPEQLTAELRWLTEDGATVIATDRVTLWLAPAGAGAQTWCLQAPAWGARLQIAVSVPSGLTTTSVSLIAQVVGSFRDRPAGRSVVTPACPWGADLTSSSRARMSPAVLVCTATVPTGKVWRDVLSPSWPGERLTLNVQTVNALTGDMAFNLFGVNDAQAIDAVASWTLKSGERRWSWTVDTPPDMAVGFSLPNPSGAASGSWDVEAVWSSTPVGLPGVLLSA